MLLRVAVAGRHAGSCDRAERLSFGEAEDERDKLPECERRMARDHEAAPDTHGTARIRS